MIKIESPEEYITTEKHFTRFFWICLLAYLGNLIGFCFLRDWLRIILCSSILLILGRLLWKADYPFSNDIERKIPKTCEYCKHYHLNEELIEIEGNKSLVMMDCCDILASEYLRTNKPCERFDAKGDSE